MKVAVLNREGAETGRTVELSPEIFGQEPNNHAIYLDVKQFMANQRQGTHKTKNRWEIHRSTRKVIRQKGTGGARHGSLKSGIYVGGARIHGPEPRDYSFKLNKKLKVVARLSALAYKAKDQQIRVIEDFDFDKPKTSDFAKLLVALKVNTGRTLFLTSELNRNIYLSGRNIQGNVVIPAAEFNTYEVMKANTLIITEKGITTLKENLEK